MEHCIENGVAVAQAALQRADPVAAISALETVTLRKGDTESRAYRQTFVMAQIQLAMAQGNAQDWWKVFGLDRDQASSQDVRRAFKRLAAIIHPDKCQLPNARESFDALQRGLETLVQDIGRPLGSKVKRGKTFHDDNDNDNDNDDQRYAWWTEWERNRDESSSDEKRCREDCSADGKESMIKDLERRSISDLRAYIRHLQNEILTPPNANNDGHHSVHERLRPTLSQLQSTLVLARRALAAKLDSQRKCDLPDGGFLNVTAVNGQ